MCETALLTPEPACWSPAVPDRAAPPIADPLRELAQQSLVALQSALQSAGGTLIPGAGAASAGKLSVSVCSDYGPPGQDKKCNQDHVLAWVSERPDDPLQAVIVLADGVSTSFRSELGSELACHAALAEIVCQPRIGPHSVQRLDLTRSVLAAQHWLDQLFDRVRAEPETYRPARFASPGLWPYLLSQRSLFQTTLTVACVTVSKIDVAIVGDGAAWLRKSAQPPAAPVGDHRPAGNWLSRFLFGDLPQATCTPATSPARSLRDEVLAGCDAETTLTAALGPRSVTPAIRHWSISREGGDLLLALSTDGVARGLAAPFVLLDWLDAQDRDVGNPARRFLDQAIHERPDEFADNLTLATLRIAGERGTP